jgi:hypothetical protein
MKMAAFWDIAPCSLEANRRFIHHHNDGFSTYLWNVGLFQQDYTMVYPSNMSSLCEQACINKFICAITKIKPYEVRLIKKTAFWVPTPITVSPFWFPPAQNCEAEHSSFCPGTHTQTRFRHIAAVRTSQATAPGVRRRCWLALWPLG